MFIGLICFEDWKMKAIVKIEKNGLIIPIEKLKGFNEDDLVEVLIKKVYADDDVKKALKFAITQ
jgi:hypothetical protein